MVPIKIDHIVLRVTDFDDAIIFYKTLFAYVDWKIVEDPLDERSLGFSQSDDFTLWISEEKSAHIGPGHGYLDHLALHCDSEQAVHDAHEFCLSQKWEILSAPQSYPAYGNFYGFSFEGPDQLKIEFVTR